MLLAICPLGRICNPSTRSICIFNAKKKVTIKNYGSKGRDVVALQMLIFNAVGLQIRPNCVNFLSRRSAVNLFFAQVVVSGYKFLIFFLNEFFQEISKRCIFAPYKNLKKV